VTHAAVLAVNTFREAVRDRVLTAVLAFGAAFVCSSVVIAPLTLGEQERIVRDLGLASISLFSVLLIVLVGTALVHREIERRTIHTILAHPVSRASFILGKFLGLYATVLLSIAMLSVVYLAVVALFGGGLRADLLVTIALCALEALVVTAIAVLFSTVASPLLSAVFTLLVFVAGHLAHDVKELAGMSASPVISAVTSAIYAVLPSLHYFDARNNLLTGIPVPTGQVLGCLAYSLLYTAAVLGITIVAFRSRDFE